MKVELNKDAIILKLQRELHKAVQQTAIEVTNDCKDRLMRKSSSLSSGSIASAPGQPPATSSGALARGMADKDVTTSPNHPRFLVGNSVVYSRIQELGGRIQARKSQYLTIPIGVDGRRAARDAGGNIRSLNLRAIWTSHGGYLVKDLNKGERAAKGSKAARGAQSVLLFALRKSVYLPPRPYLRPSLEAGRVKLKELSVKAINRVFAGVAG